MSGETWLQIQMGFAIVHILFAPCAPPAGRKFSPCAFRLAPVGVSQATVVTLFQGECGAPVISILHPCVEYCIH